MVTENESAGVEFICGLVIIAEGERREQCSRTHFPALEPRAVAGPPMKFELG